MAKDEELQSFLKVVFRRIAGKNAEDLIEILYNKENINEFKIAERLKKNINEVRNMLYKLSSFNVISSTRKKDKRKGWYTYFWTLNLEKALDTLLRLKEQELFNLEHIIKSRSLKQFYFCESDNIEMSEETALHHNFLCPECSQLLTPVNEEKKIKEMNLRVEASRKEINELREKVEKLKQERLRQIEPKTKKKSKKAKKTRKTKPTLSKTKKPKLRKPKIKNKKPAKKSTPRKSKAKKKNKKRF